MHHPIVIAALLLMLVSCVACSSDSGSSREENYFGPAYASCKDWQGFALDGHSEYSLDIATCRNEYVILLSKRSTREVVENGAKSRGRIVLDQVSVAATDRTVVTLNPPCYDQTGRTGTAVELVPVFDRRALENGSARFTRRNGSVLRGWTADLVNEKLAEASDDLLDSIVCEYEVTE